MTCHLEEIAGVFSTQAVNEVPQLVNAAFADVFQVLS